MAEEKRVIDWEAVEREYRAGVRSLRDIAAEFGCSHVAIKKRAEKDGWTRDLSAKIKAAAEDKVTKAAVTKLVTAETKIAEREVIEVNAQMRADVILAHRRDISRSRGIVNSMFAELELECGPDNARLLEKLGELMRSPDENGQDKLNDLYQKIIGLPGRAKTMKELTESLTKLIDKERQAFGIDEKNGKEEQPTTFNLQF